MALTNQQLYPDNSEIGHSIIAELCHLETDLVLRIRFYLRILSSDARSNSSSSGTRGRR